MTPHGLDPVVRHVRAVGGTAADQPDAALLIRFCTNNDEAAFAELVRRHGPMVLGLCRRLLANTHAADDAFQATFLLLARKAGRLRRPDVLGPWLYGVARRVALKARAAAVRRREVAVVDVPTPPPADPLAGPDLRPVLDAAIARLPARYRPAVVLCYLQGLTYTEAAERLGCPPGTVATRLARARERLRVLLTRQGMAPAAGAVAAALTPDATSAVIPDELLRATARWAAALAAGPAAATTIPAHILALTNEVARTMVLDKLKLLAAVALVGAAGAGVALSRPTGREPPAKADAPPAVAKMDAPRDPAPAATRTLPPALLRQSPPKTYLLDAGDVLGVFVEGILGEKRGVPPVMNIKADNPTVGYPVVVQDDGTISLPLLDLMDVRGRSVAEVRTKIKESYTGKGLMGVDFGVMVGLAKSRTYHVTIVSPNDPHQISPGTRIIALDLPAYENDVLSALARTSVLAPKGDGAIVIQRAGADGNAASATAGVRQVRIPMRIRPDQPLPFKPDDVVLRNGDVIVVEAGDEPAPSRGPTAEPDRSPQPPVALTLAVATPDGRILVQMPGGAWKLFDAAKVTATETDGRAVVAVALADRLKAMAAVLVATDGRTPPAQYLQLVKPGALVLVLPKD